MKDCGLIASRIFLMTEIGTRLRGSLAVGLESRVLSL